MGSSMKTSIFDEQTSRALKKWRMAVKKKKGRSGGKSPSTTTLSGIPTSSTLHAGSGRALHRFKTTGHSVRLSDYEDHESSDFEADPLSSTTNLIITVDPDHEQQSEVVLDHDHHHEEETINEDDVSFVKPDYLLK